MEVYYTENFFDFSEMIRRGYMLLKEEERVEVSVEVSGDANATPSSS